MLKYNFKEIESKWQKVWDEQQLYKAPDHPRGEKYYMLVMFAYPSGDIHMGHFRNYILGDATARFQMMKGKDMLHPFGWDAFGLPAERAAIQRGLHPAEWTYKNIETSRKTLQTTGISFDWSREVTSCSPDYYKWTQWMFVQLFKKGLAYQKKGWVNWCPEDKTVLANEQVVDGKCERCDTQVEKKELTQWYFRITDYADRLIDGLDTLPGWPENVKMMQKDWIGRSYGLEVDFIIKETGEKMPIFTTRPDTIYGVTFMAIAPESPLVEKLNLKGEYKEKVEQYKKEVLMRSEIDRAAAVGEKDGVFTGKYAINPFNGEEIELWVADYVLAGYGTGAVMAVPAHDSRDFLFAKKYKIPIKVVIHPDAKTTLKVDEMDDAYTEYGVMVNSAHFDGLAGEEAIRGVGNYAEEKGIGRKKVNYKLRDWLISRQRYWGAPIPIIHCPKCGTVAVPEKDLPVLLPEVENYIPKGRSPLADVPEYMHVKCPDCGGEAQRDPDTMDTFVCSSWYYLRYADPHNEQKPFDNGKLDPWMPIDKYIGGITHATGHLIYFRFFQKFLKDIGWVKDEEPAVILFNLGMVMDAKGEVMSKSRGNVVSPIGLMDQRGIDISRLGMYFTAPSEKEVLWSDDVLVGIEKFVRNRFFPMTGQYRGSHPDLKSYFKLSDLSDYEKNTYIKLNQTVKRVSEDIDRLQFNTAIAALMELEHDYKPDQIKSDTLNDYIILKAIQLIAPLAPHLAEEMWQLCGNELSVFRSAWPDYDPDAVKFDTVTIAIQVNGKLRSDMEMLRDMAQDEVISAALKDTRVKAYTDGKEIIKKIYIPNRLVNIVIK
ncbi:MAG: leucine--tRNA ligase [candidate division Zixibacteria bacterium HGW-Zixibacteria-1]|nr:MAG: leucine--tRNA ligase [candidate division Zixibacteria bacterium HGW-Zixibacteria-1]